MVGTRATALSHELRELARQHPRATWSSHPNLGDTARFWLQRHDMFRQLDQLLRGGIEEMTAGRADVDQFKPWLARHASWFLGELEHHHQVEDFHYFPLFRRAAPRLEAGFALLDRDHQNLHTRIEALGMQANAVLAATPTDDGDFRSALGRLDDRQRDLGEELGRHLDDEEDLVVPLILDRGEPALMGGH